ncbi:VOC family protein [Paenibacillus flagellatus]|nr:VOC family protein [Paenibacillus flagellatus]
MKAHRLRPFVPSGADYSVALQFYTDLGFEKIASHDGGAIFRIGEAEFHLQHYYHEELQNNFMMELCVHDLDAWWEHIRSTGVLDRYTVKATPPKIQPYGKRAIHLIDPAGVLWHITE